MAVTTSYSGSRSKNAHAAAFAAKQKRQKVIIGVGVVLLLLVLAYEVPKTLKLMHGSSSPTAPAPAETAAPTPAASGAATPTHAPKAAWRALRHLAPHDPFANAVAGDAGTYGNVSVPAKLNDPFAATVSSASSTTSSSASVASTTPSLPKTIVVGTPGAGRKAQTGWIVILASIPSGQGRSAANAFAKRAAGRGVGTVSILNSSKARPLRGGYWVVYSGPFPTLSVVTKDASHLHAVGYGTAYVRQLVVYRKS